MSPIPDEVIEQVRDAADIVELIGEHVDLRRTGSDYRGPCPFHGGTHRNFAVIPKKQMFYCFVCHEGGDVFTFYMKRFGLDYPGAVREVARRVGVAIPERGPAGPDPREPLFEAVALAAEWYARRFREGEDAARARGYVEERGFSLDRLAPMGLGYAPAGGDFLEAMRRLGVSDDVLLEAGLALKRDGGELRPRFWNRLLFPIHDLRGRVVGFGGRILGEGEPKYLNSPDSAVFHKGQLLYNLHHAKQAIRQEGQALVVEGYFDVLRLLDVGLDHVVAPLGTGLSSQQALLIRRFAEQVVLLYDSDAAGLRATFRAADVLLSAGCRVLVATLPAGVDPDSFARSHGKEGVERLLEDAVDVLERKIQLLERKGRLSSLAGRRDALDRLLPTVRAATDPVTRDLYIARVSEVLGVSADTVRREVAAGRPPFSATEPRRAANQGARAADLKSGPERELLRVLVHAPEWRSRIKSLVADRSDWPQAAAEVFDRVAELGDRPAGEALLSLEGRARALLEELLSEAWGPPGIDALVEAAINRLEGRRLRAELERVQQSLPFVPESEKLQLVERVRALRDRIAVLDKGHWGIIRAGRSSES
ncbi:DNA primase [bacterium HR33]|nr:DNA primase [bacterium HR33]